MALYTKNGRPLQVHGDIVYSGSGVVVGRINNDKAYGTDGDYVGTIDNDRLVYRDTDSAAVMGTFSVADCAGTGMADISASSIWGDEPEIPD